MQFLNRASFNQGEKKKKPETDNKCKKENNIVDAQVIKLISISTGFEIIADLTLGALNLSIVYISITTSTNRALSRGNITLIAFICRSLRV